MFFELVKINQVRTAEVPPVFYVVDSGIAKVVERGLEGSGNFKRVVLQVVGFWDGGDKGHNMVAVNRIEIVQTSEHVDLPPRDTKLFFGFAQGGRSQVDVFGIMTAAGKGNLSGVVFKVCRALGKEQIVAVATLVERQQYGGWPQ